MDKENKKNNVQEPKGRRGRFIALSVGLVALFGVMLGAILAVDANNRDYQNRLEGIYQHAFYEYTTAVDNIEMNLSKMMVSSAPAYGAELAAKTYRHAEVASAMLAQLPFTADTVAQEGKFLNQVGDWCLSYARNLSVNEGLESYRAQVEDLYVTAAALGTKLSEGETAYRAGGFKRMASLKPYAGEPEPIHEPETERISPHSVEYPEMIYDGPFSDSQQEKPFKTFESVAVLDEPAVARTVKEKLPYQIDSLNLRGQSACMARCYEYEAETSAGRAFVSASEYGGRILNFDLQRPIGAATLSEENARQKAKDYAAALGYDVEPVWYNTTSGTGVVVLARVDSGTVYFPDMIKIKVALDNGGLLGAETKSYCQNYYERSYTPRITEATARSMLPANAAVASCRKAVVPTPDGKEKLCYELAFTSKGLDYITYICAATGREVNILRVIDSPQGKTTY